MKLLIAINSWAKGATNGDNQAMRDTFLKNIAMFPDLDYRFFVGDGTPTGENEKELQKSLDKSDRPYKEKYELFKDLRIKFTPKPDEVVLPIPDDYAHVSYKTREGHRWAIHNGFDFIFQCYPDTFICLSRLLSSGFEKHHYIGKATSTGYAGSGCGYWLDREVSELLIKAPVTDWAEDRWVHSILLGRNVQLHIDDRYADYPLHPEPGNSIITSHLSGTPNIYDNRMMYNMYQTAQQEGLL